MDLQNKIREVLAQHYGKFETYLEHIYEDQLTDALANGSLKKKEAWVTYNQVILELKHSLKDSLKVKELQYKLTDGGDPNRECISVIDEVKDRSPELDRLYYKIRNLI